MLENTVTVELDLAYDDDLGLQGAIDKLRREFEVETVVTREDGPGGGWPEVTVTGQVDRVIAALIEAWGMGTQEVLYTLGYDAGDGVLDA